MITSQDWLESFGLATKIRSGPAPGIRINPTIPKGNHSKAKRILQSEQNDKIDARTYQSALVYSGESYNDSGQHWQRREPSDKLIAGRQRSAHHAMQSVQEHAVVKRRDKARRIKIHVIQKQLKARPKTMAEVRIIKSKVKGGILAKEVGKCYDPSNPDTR